LGVNKFYEDADEKNNPGETKNYLVKRCEYISEKKLKLQNARLYHHFINIGIEPGYIMQRWIKCLFTREFHPQDSAVVWDAILANEIMEPSENLSYVDYFSLAMLDFISDELLSKDQSECFKRLFTYPPLESMSTLINLTAKIKPIVIELEQAEIEREKEFKEKELRNRKKLDEILKRNRKLKKEQEENIEKKQQIENNNNINNNFNNINLFNNILFANQLNLMQNPNMFINNTNAKYLSPQLNNIQNQNQQLFPQMNIMFNNSTNMMININNINNKKEEKNKIKENKENTDYDKSALDLLKNTYSESIEDKNKLFNELKSIFNKYKKNFTYDDCIKTDSLLDKLQKKL
jgi:TBC1 domain family protein 5